MEAVATEGTAKEATFEWSLTKVSLDFSAVTALLMVFTTSAKDAVECIVQADRGVCYG